MRSSHLKSQVVKLATVAKRRSAGVDDPVGESLASGGTFSASAAVFEATGAALPSRSLLPGHSSHGFGAMAICKLTRGK